MASSSHSYPNLILTTPLDGYVPPDNSWLYDFPPSPLSDQHQLLDYPESYPFRSNIYTSGSRLTAPRSPRRQQANQRQDPWHRPTDTLYTPTHHPAASHPLPYIIAPDPTPNSRPEHLSVASNSPYLPLPQNTQTLLQPQGSYPPSRPAPYPDTSAQDSLPSFRDLLTRLGLPPPRVNRHSNRYSDDATYRDAPTIPGPAYPRSRREAQHLPAHRLLEYAQHRGLNVSDILLDALFPVPDRLQYEPDDLVDEQPGKWRKNSTEGRVLAGSRAARQATKRLARSRRRRSSSRGNSTSSSDEHRRRRSRNSRNDNRSPESHSDHDSSSVPDIPQYDSRSEEWSDSEAEIEWVVWGHLRSEIDD